MGTKSGLVLPRLRDKMKNMSSDLKSRKYCFTIYDYERSFDNFLELAKSLTKHRYICFGLEICPDTGRPHIQGYVELNQAQRLTFIQKYFDFRKEDGKLNKFHIEIANGTTEQNKKYTGKENNFYEFGEPVTQGARNDLIEIKEKIKNNPKNLNQIIDEHGNNLQQVRYAQIMQPIYMSHRSPNNPPTVFWIFGPTGIGKTKLVFKTFLDICSVSSYKWLGTDYNQNECFLLDDFRELDLPFNTILKITDRYPFTLEFKGSQIPLNSPYIIFTSPKSISDTFRSTGEDIAQIKRRVTEIHLSTIEEAENINLLDLDPKYIHGGVNDYKKFWG